VTVVQREVKPNNNADYNYSRLQIRKPERSTFTMFVLKLDNVKNLQ